ncbi:hypothetical protein ACRAWD_12620 [Caulobacter segnis]
MTMFCGERPRRGSAGPADAGGDRPSAGRFRAEAPRDPVPQPDPDARSSRPSPCWCWAC